MTNILTYNTPTFKRDVFLLVEDYLQLDGLEAVKFRNLSEDMKAKAANKVTNFIFSRVSKAYENDPVLRSVMKSRGFVTRIEEHEQFEAALTEYAAMTKRSNPEVYKYVERVEIINKFLKKNASVFDKAFKNDNKILMFYYSSNVTLMYQALAYIMSISLDFNANRTGMSAIVSMKVDPKNLTDNIILTALENQSNLIKNRQADEFLGKAVEYSVINEELTTMTLLFSVGVVVATLWFIRDFIEFILIFRNRVADWFESYAIFLEARNAYLRQNNKNAADKQMAIATRFRKISDTIRVEVETGNKEAIKTINQQNKKIDVKQLGSGNFDSTDLSGLI